MALNVDSSQTYYQHSKHVPFASRLSQHVRRKMFAAFLETMRPGPDDTVLDVGVTGDRLQPESNYFERMYPYPHRITCVGTEDASHLEATYPGLRFQPVAHGQALPFQDQQFNLAFSNAVLEHTGSRPQQARFLAEIARVSQRFFVTTPNRWFPVEHHTGLPFVHYLPPALFRRLIGNTRYRFWADEANLNMLSRAEIKTIMPPRTSCTLLPVGVFGITSNFVLVGGSGRDSFEKS